jgi:hypothetical protein
MTAIENSRNTWMSVANDTPVVLYAESSASISSYDLVAQLSFGKIPCARSSLSDKVDERFECAAH